MTFSVELTKEDVENILESLEQSIEEIDNYIENHVDEDEVDLLDACNKNIQTLVNTQKRIAPLVKKFNQ